jgi:hypothetical protein
VSRSAWQSRVRYYPDASRRLGGVDLVLAQLREAYVRDAIDLGTFERLTEDVLRGRTIHLDARPAIETLDAWGFR